MNESKINRSRVFPFLLWGAAGLLLPSGCQSIETAEEDKTSRFFDLEGYFEQEKIRLRALDLSGVKTVRLNGEEETIELDSLPLENDFAIFLNSDINRRAWIDKYDGDTIYSAKGNLMAIRYQSNDPKLKVQSIEIQLEEEEVSSIQIERTMESLIAQTKQELSYNAGRDYQVASIQSSIMGDTTLTKVQLRIQ
ncbi:MAG: hypothetical protein AAGH79_12245 [Bacteroidota bacterium]